VYSQLILYAAVLVEQDVFIHQYGCCYLTLLLISHSFSLSQMCAHALCKRRFPEETVESQFAMPITLFFRALWQPIQHAFDKATSDTVSSCEQPLFNRCSTVVLHPHCLQSRSTALLYCLHRVECTAVVVFTLIAVACRTNRSSLSVHALLLLLAAVALLNTTSHRARWGCLRWQSSATTSLKTLTCC
jgi:hypothetical protein